MKSKLLPMAAAVAFALGSGVASAFTLPPGSGTTAGAKAEDTNVDWIIQGDTDPLITVGDRLVSVLEFNTIVDTLAANGQIPTQTLNDATDELVAIADVTVVDVRLLGGVLPLVTLAPTQGVSAVRVFSLGSETNLDIGTFTNCTNLATCLAAVADGNPWAEFSIIDLDDQWTFLGTDPSANDPSYIAGLDQTTIVGNVSFALSLVPGTNFSGYDFLNLTLNCNPTTGIFACNGDGLTQLRGNSIVYGGAGFPAGLGAFAATDTDVSVNVPEPGSLALLGLGLLGLGASRRRKA